MACAALSGSARELMMPQSTFSRRGFLETCGAVAEVPVVCAWFPTARAVVVWNLTEQRQEMRRFSFVRASPMCVGVSLDSRGSPNPKI